MFALTIPKNKRGAHSKSVPLSRDREAPWENTNKKPRPVGRAPVSIVFPDQEFAVFDRNNYCVNAGCIYYRPFHGKLPRFPTFTQRATVGKQASIIIFLHFLRFCSARTLLSKAPIRSNRYHRSMKCHIRLRQL